MTLVNTCIIARYGVMNYSLLMPNSVALYVKLHEILYSKNELHIALEVSHSIYSNQELLL